MKKTLLLVLALFLVIFSLGVSARDFFFNSGGIYQITGYIVGNCEVAEPDDTDLTEYSNYYTMTVDTNTEFVFETALDILTIAEVEKGGESFFNFFNGEKASSDVCSVNYNTAKRFDTEEYWSLDVDLENEVEYILEGASVRFNVPGVYLITATLGSATGDERIHHLVGYDYAGDTYYSQPEIIISVNVSDKTTSEDIYDSFYDESLFTVSGITGYNEDQDVMGDFRVAVCTSPVVITANSDLSNICLTKLVNVGGVWQEKRFFDSMSFVLGDGNKNWMPAPGYEEDFEDCYEFTGTEDLFYDEIIVKKGTSIAFSEPGMYTVWANGVDGGVTGLTFEMADSIAKYTNSKVLVDGTEVKFEAYNINDNNYFKLRDIAQALTKYSVCANRFNVKWDGNRNMINLVSNDAYESVGGELEVGDGTNKKFQNSTSALLKDGVNVSLKAYLINGNNYFKLRDLGKLVGFNVSWDGSITVFSLIQLHLTLTNNHKKVSLSENFFLI